VEARLKMEGWDITQPNFQRWVKGHNGLKVPFLYLVPMRHMGTRTLLKLMTLRIVLEIQTS